MPTFWFNVFTIETWEEAIANGLSVSGFSRAKFATLKRVKPGDVLICYLKGQMRLIGALRVTGTPYLAEEPRIWKSQTFPARVPVEPVLTLNEADSVDFVALLPQMSFFHADNMRKAWARLQGSPTLLRDEDGLVLMQALQEAATVQLDDVDSGYAMEANAPAPGAIGDTEARPALTLLDPLEALVDELEAAQRDTMKPARFERAIAEVFRFLGFDIQLHGQSGTTDVLVESRLGLEHYRAVVDAKASGTGKVSESHINWAAVADHRQKASADYAMVIGERFAGGNLTKFAIEFGVALLDVSSITTILRLHTLTPFSASDLRALFATPGTGPSVIADLQQKSATTARHWQLVAEVIRLVDGFSRSEPPISPTLGHLHGALLGALFVESSLDQRTGPLPSQQDVLDAVAFLASRTVAILRPVEPAETAGYRLTVSPHAALQRLQSMEHVIRGVFAPINSMSSEPTVHADLTSL